MFTKWEKETFELNQSPYIKSPKLNIKLPVAEHSAVIFCFWTPGTSVKEIAGIVWLSWFVFSHGVIVEYAGTDFLAQNYVFFR